MPPTRPGVACSNASCGEREDTRRVQVLNGGIVGSTIAQGLARYRSVRADWQPRVVVAAFGAINEQWPAWEGLTDRDKIPALAARLEAGDSWRLTLRKELRLLHALAKLADAREGGKQAIATRVAEELVAEDAKIRDYLDDPEYLARVPLDDFERYLGQLRDEVRADGAELVLLAMPRKLQVEETRWPVREYDAVLERFAEERGVRLARGRERFRAEVAQGVAEDELFVDSFHPSPRGHELLAEEVGAAVRAVLDE